MSKIRKVFVDVETSMNGVTGSIYLLTIHFTSGMQLRILIDCGKENQEEDFEPFEGFFFNPSLLDAIFITHAHLDHYGRLAELFHNGANCKVFCAKGTEALLPLALTNSFAVDMSKVRKFEKMPYQREDIEKVISMLNGVDYNTNILVIKSPEYSVIVKPLYNAHIPGSTMFLITVNDPDDKTKNAFLFSGDYKEHSALCVEEIISDNIYEMPINLFIESTYGGVSKEETKYEFMDNLISSIYNHGNKVIVPSISLERFQEIMFLLKKAQEDGTLSKKIPIYVDAPLAINYTRIFLHDDRIKLKEECKKILPENLTIGTSIPFGSDPAIYVVGGGMGHGPSQGYILRALPRSDCTIIFTCYQAEGTLGRMILESESSSSLDLFGLKIVKKANILWTGEFSGHAHQEGLLKFVSKFSNLQSITVSHGSSENRQAFVEKLQQDFDCEVNEINKNVYFTFQSNELKKIRPSKIVCVTETITKEKKAKKKKDKKKKKKNNKGGRFNGLPKVNFSNKFYS